MSRPGCRSLRPERACLSCGRSYVPWRGKKGGASRFCSRRCVARVLGPKRSHSADARTKFERGVIGTQGYVMVYEDAPRRGSRRRQVREHRVIAERTLGRPLTADECVHHVDMNKANNRRDNLVICTRSYHRVIHHMMGRRWVEGNILASS